MPFYKYIFTKKLFKRLLFYLSLIFFPFSRACGNTVGFPLIIAEFSDNNILNNFHLISLFFNIYIAILIYLVYKFYSRKYSSNPAFFSGIKCIILYHLITYSGIFIFTFLDKINIKSDFISSLSNAFLYFVLFVGACIFNQNFINFGTNDFFYFHDSLDIPMRINYVCMILIYFLTGYYFKRYYLKYKSQK